MLDSLRRGAGTWVAKIFLGILMVSFAVWGIADIFTGYRGDTLITVGETEIAGEEYRYELQGEMQDYGRRIGRPLTLDEARGLGIDAQVLGRLITEAALDEKARAMGLGMSDDAIAEAIRNDPQFQTPGGSFDRSYFQQVLRATGQSEAGFVARQRATMLRQAIGNALTGGTVPAKTLREAVHTFANETRSMDYFVIGADDLPAISPPDETTLIAYFDANKARFSAPEYRKLSVLAIDPETLSAGIEVSDDDARQEYEARRDRYQVPERRQVKQIVYAERTEADAALAEIRAGKSFDEIASARGLGAGEADLGLIEKSAIVDTTVADAVFALTEGAVSDVIDGQFGFVLATVTSIEPGIERQFEDVKPEIVAALKVIRAEGEVLDLHDNIEDARAGGQTLAEIAMANNLELLTFDAVDSGGRGRDGETIEDIPAANELVRDAFQSDVGIENDPIQQRGTSFIWYEVLDVEAPRERTLDEARERVIAAWTDTQRNEQLTKAAGEAVDAIRGGEPITAVAGRYGRSVTTASNLKRTDQSGPAGAQAVQRLFLLKPGDTAHTATAEGPNRIVFVMTGSTVPPSDPQSELYVATQERLSLAQSNDVLAQYVGGLRDEFGVEVNPDLLRQLLGQSDPAGSQFQ